LKIIISDLAEPERRVSPATTHSSGVFVTKAAVPIKLSVDVDRRKSGRENAAPPSSPMAPSGHWTLSASLARFRQRGLKDELSHGNLLLFRS
jgi:hypothetical protein